MGVSQRRQTHPLHLLKQQWDVIDAFRDNGRDLIHPQSLTQSGIYLQIWANGKRWVRRMDMLWFIIFHE